MYKELEQAASDFLAALDKKYNSIEQANMPHIICEEAFEAGVLWERERSKVLVDALKRIAAMSDDAFMGKWVSEFELREIAQDAFKQYEAADE